MGHFSAIDIGCVSLETVMSGYDTVVLPVFSDEWPDTGGVATLLQPLPDTLKQRFKAKHSEMISHYLPEKTILILGLGEKSKVTAEKVRQAFGAVSRQIKGKTGVVLGPITLALGREKAISVVIEGVVLGSYTYDRYKSEKKPLSFQSVHLAIAQPDAQADAALRTGLVTAQATCHSRDLANTPANDLTPTLFLKEIRTLFTGLPIQIEVITHEKAAALGMGGLLGVAQGSAEVPVMVCMSYQGQGKGTPIGLVGKGVTFDSGGISIKPAKGMKDMKADMTGAASVVSAIWAAASLQLAKPILGIVALTENMPSGTALKPGDVIRAMTGKTIEIVNTDAEGRLVLADALALACQKGASPVIDMATLTGACGVALGDLACGVLGTDQVLIDRLRQIGDETGERVWQLPLYAEYLDAMKSDVADIANANETGKGGTCTAAKFLEQFVGDTPWVHIDIASMMTADKTKGYQVKGMSGVGARLLLGVLQ